MKKILFLAAILVTTASISQAKKELETEVATLNQSVSELEIKNKELHLQVTEFRSKYENALSERIDQETKKSELQQKIDSLSLLPSATDIRFDNVQLVEFSNQTAKFMVPVGETWEIVNIWADYVVNVNIEKDEADYVYIYIESLNGKILTDASNNKFGACVYRGPSHEMAIKMPIILPENTEISFVLMSRNFNQTVSSPNNNLSGYINYIVH